MKTSMMSATLGVGLLSVSAGAAILAAPGQKYQEYTGRPGDPTQAKVWIQNTPLMVEVNGTPTVTLSSGTVVQAKLVRQTWEYRIVNITTGQTPAGALAGPAAEGWEATGVVFPTSDGTSLLLKRPGR